MSNAQREETLQAYASAAAERLLVAGEALARRQVLGGAAHGNVPPWPGADDLDFHGTLSAIWLWSRAQKLTGQDRFALNVAAAWAFVDASWSRFIPPVLGPTVGEEAPYDCALVLRAALAGDAPHGSPERRVQVAAAARLLAVHLADLQELSGRGFADPGFLAWNLAEYARFVNDRGLLAAARKFVDRAFGMKSPPSLEAEPALSDALFDFSSTTATRVLAVVAAEGATPFVGAWLRERVAAGVPTRFVSRPMDENSWNACAAVALGRAYVVSTDPRFQAAHELLVGELTRRAPSGALGRQQGFPAETAATFYYGLALDAAVKETP